MSKQFKNIDDLFRSEFGGSEITPPSSVKANIDSALGFNKKRRGFLWIGLFAMIGIGTMVALLVRTSQPKASQPDDLRATIETCVTNSQSPNDTSMPLNQPAELSADHSSHTVSPSQNISIDPSNLTPSKDPNQANEEPKKSTIQRQEDLLLASQITDNGRISEIVDEPETPETNVDEEEHSQTQTDLNQLETTKKDESYDENLLSDGLSETLAKEESDPKDSLPTIDPIIHIKPELEDVFKHWMIHLSGGPNVVRSAYSANNQNDKTIYDNATSDKIGTQINFDFMYGLRKGLSFGSGIGLSNFNENYAYEATLLTLDSVENIEYVYADTTDIIIDSIIYYSYQELISKTDHIGLNNASYVHIPIHIGAQLIFGKLQVDIYSSIRFNFLTRSKGGYLLASEFIEFEKYNSIFKPFFVDLMFGSRIHYKVYKSLYATGSVQYRPLLGSVYTTNNFNKSFDYVHLGLGLSLRF